MTHTSPCCCAAQVFANNINVAIITTAQGYERLQFHEALRTGFYELLAARDEYRASVSVMHRLVVAAVAAVLLLHTVPSLVLLMVMLMMVLCAVISSIVSSRCSSFCCLPSVLISHNIYGLPQAMSVLSPLASSCCCPNCYPPST